MPFLLKSSRRYRIISLKQPCKYTLTINRRLQNNQNLYVNFLYSLPSLITIFCTSVENETPQLYSYIVKKFLHFIEILILLCMVATFVKFLLDKIKLWKIELVYSDFVVLAINQGDSGDKWNTIYYFLSTRFVFSSKNISDVKMSSSKQLFKTVHVKKGVNMYTYLPRKIALGIDNIQNGMKKQTAAKNWVFLAQHYEIHKIKTNCIK